MVRKTILLVAGCAFWWGSAAAGTSHAQQLLASPRIGGYPVGGQADPIGAGGVGRPAVSPYTNLYLADAVGMSGDIPNTRTTVCSTAPDEQRPNGFDPTIAAASFDAGNHRSDLDARPNQIIRDTGHQTRSP